MESAELDFEKNELLRVIDELSAILRSWGEDRWADRLEQDRRLVSDEHPDGFRHLLNAFGGVDGLDGLEIDAANGHSIAPEKVRPVNDRLRTLCGAVVAKAGDLQAGVRPDR